MKYDLASRQFKDMVDMLRTLNGNPEIPEHLKQNLRQTITNRNQKEAIRSNQVNLSFAANDELDLVAKPHRYSKKSSVSPRKRVHRRSLLF